MIIKVLKDFTTWDASGKVEGVKGKELDVLSDTGKRLIKMKLAVDPQAEPEPKPERKRRRKRTAKSEE